MRLTDHDVRAALNVSGEAELRQDAVYTGVSSDTRTLRPGDLFVALVNEKADGHDFVAQAMEMGASGLVVSSTATQPLSVPCYKVPDTQVAFGNLARWWREQFDIPVIGVTGSVGKTTVKEMIAAALLPLGPILKTEASRNNETGVPQTLLQLQSSHRAAVIEMGMRGTGQIRYLCGIARPTVGVLTVISDNHLELLGSREAIAAAKGELLEDLPSDGVAILNADDPFFPSLSARTRSRIIPYHGNSRTVEGLCLKEISPAAHDAGNALAALAVAEALGVRRADALAALQRFRPAPMRMQVIQTSWGGTVINDSYNAAPMSMQSALETLAHREGGRKIAFLGDMKELGPAAQSAHEEVGTVIGRLGGLDMLITVGPLADYIPGANARFTNSDEAARYVSEQFSVQAGDVILVKGSRAMAMERIAERLAGMGISA